MGNSPDFYNLIARDRGAPEGWRWFDLRVIGERPHHVIHVKGAVCDAVYKSGRYKGWPNWTKRDRSTERELVITPAEFDAAIAKWESETGLCHKCGGDGQELASCGVGGNTYRPCSRCKASGKAPSNG